MTEISNIENPVNSINDTTDVLSPVKATKRMLKKVIYPQDYKRVADMSYHMPSAEEMYGNELRQLQNLEQKYYDLKESFYGPQDRKNSFSIKPISQKDGIP